MIVSYQNLDFKANIISNYDRYEIEVAFRICDHTRLGSTKYKTNIIDLYFTLGLFVILNVIIGHHLWEAKELGSRSGSRIGMGNCLRIGLLLLFAAHSLASLIGEPMAVYSRSTYKDFVNALRSFDRELKGGNIVKLTVVFGPSDYFIQKASHYLRQRFAAVDSNCCSRSMEAVELTIKSFYQLCETKSIFEPMNVYFFKRVEKKLDFYKFLKEIPDIKSLNNHIVLSYCGASLPIRVKKELERLGAFNIPCYDPTGYELKKIIEGLSKKNGIQLDNSASELLLDLHGTDLVKLENEIVKLSFIFKDSKMAKLDSNKIAPFLGMLREDHAFALESSLLSQKSLEAEILVNDLLRRGEKPLALLGILAAFCRKAIRVSVAKARGLSERQIAADLKLPGQVVRNYLKYVNTLEPKKLFNILARCRDADVRLKTSSSSDELIISEILSELT